MDLLPVNVGLKLVTRVRVRLLPAPAADDVARSMLHWLFCNVAGVASTPAAPQPMPLSLITWIECSAAVYSTAHALTPLVEVPNNVRVEVSEAKPVACENVN